VAGTVEVGYLKVSIISPANCPCRSAAIALAQVAASPSDSAQAKADFTTYFSVSDRSAFRFGASACTARDNSLSAFPPAVDWMAASTGASAACACSGASLPASACTACANSLSAYASVVDLMAASTGASAACACSGVSLPGSACTACANAQNASAFFVDWM